jgi:hypothetical protein
MSKCEHGKRKTTCTSLNLLFNSEDLCEHGHKKSICKNCISKDLCEHRTPRLFCKLCGNCYYCGKIWENRIKKTTAKQCNCKDICEHGLQYIFCKDCNGSSIYINKKPKIFYKKCNNYYNKILCEHGKCKSRCKICGGSSLCKSSWCETYGNNKYEGYCVACFVNNPENQHKPVMRNYRTKEKDVVTKITETFTNFTWVSDKRVQDGCSRRRPDLLLDMGSHVIIVEIDENKHTNYDCSCENKRLMELSQDLQHRPIVFIRFNPDDYTNQEGVIVKSCWKLNKFGVMQIMKTKEKEWEERIDVLKEQIQYWIDNPTQKTVEIIELFY